MNDLAALIPVAALALFGLIAVFIVWRQDRHPKAKHP